MKTIIIDGVEYNLTPKIMFKNGTWLVENEPNNYARFIQILEVVDVQGKERYRFFRDLHNDEDVVECRFIENNYHSFNIKDAKDGDVLTTDTWTFIFKKYQDKSVYYHCAVSTFNNFSTSDSGEFDSNYVHPSTKEQRDTLFAKMHEAGYEWNAEKKELKKIEQKIVDKVEHNVHLTEFEDAVKDMMNDYRDAIGDNDATIDEIKEHAAYLLSLIHQNPDWSEEDKEMLRRCIRATFVHGYLKECNWLKSINERVSNFDDGYKVGFSAAKYNQWKPSDEQMKALKDACDEHLEPDGLDPLYTLWEQLKKLKE